MRKPPPIPAKYRPGPGLRRAINAKCYTCTYDHLDAGSAATQIENCTLVHCPLHVVRPRKKR